MTILPCLLACLLPLACVAADLPGLTIPWGAGVNIHFLRGHEKDLELIAAAGFKFIRMDMGWAGVERQRGQYDWSAQDELLANLDRRGLRALFILDYSNPLYEETISSRDPVSGQTHRDTASPRHPESVAAFARWAAAAAEHFRGRRVIWEIWNEPNIGFWKPKPEVKQYLELARATCQAIRKADPHATIVAPASSEFPWSFLETLCQSGLLEQLDAVSVHPYRHPQRPPETAAADYLRLRHLLERYTPAGKRVLPILSGEWGYSSNTKGVSAENQAAFLVRQQLHNLLCGIPVSIWYDWKNDGADPSENEHNFGTVWPDLKPKPAYLAMEVFTRELGGFTITHRLDRPASSDFILLLTNAVGQQKLAAWTTDGTRDLELPLGLPAESLALVDGQGHKQSCLIDQGKVRLRLTGLPQYLALAKPSPQLSAAGAWGIGPTRRSLRSGEPKNLRLPVHGRNPFSRTARVQTRVSCSDGQKAETTWKRLAPGQTFQHEFDLTIRQRWPETVSVRVTTQFFLRGAQGADEPLETSGEEILFSIGNPLRLSLAPVENGWQLQAHNPAHTIFKGTAELGQEIRPLHLTEQTPEARIHWTADAARKDQPLRVRIKDQAGHAVASSPERVFLPLPLPSLQAALDGDNKIPATSTIALTNAPESGGKPWSRAWRLDYRFDAGWRFVRCVTATPEPIPDHASSIGMWIYGDQSNNLLRLRFTDESGQTFQPDGPRLDWQGWRWIELELADAKDAGHWGGANDGRVHGRSHLDCLLLLDGTAHQTAGAIYVAGPAWIQTGRRRPQ